MNQEAILWESNCPTLNRVSRGKVRDIYDVGKHLLIVTTDRISAFDVVMPNGIPFKGKVLNRLSEFWFNFLKVNHHMITCDVDEMPEEISPYKDQLRDRSMLVKKANPFPVECVARGYIIGSGWKDYQKTGSVCGIQLPEGLKQAAKFETPIFTPATKAKMGDHDENIDFETMVQTVGAEKAQALREITLSIYKKGADFAETKGLILADTKFEFGLIDGEIVLIDEVLTPDSSRYWPQDQYKEGISPPSFDKQFVRDFLEEIKFDKQPPGPELPVEIVQKTGEKYLEAFERITGKAPNF